MTSKASTAEKPLVLIADDDPAMRLLASEFLDEGGFSVREAENGKEALEAFKVAIPDIVLLDVNMPTMDGFTACKSLRSLPGGEETPIVMMTGLNDMESINRAYDVGANDFVTKPVNWAILRHRLRYMLRASQAEKEIRFLAYYDTLTNLPNRTQFEQHLARVLEDSQRSKRRVAVMFIDLDRFKRINDTFGHGLGDLLIKQVADRLNRLVRASDCFSRFGEGPEPNASLCRFGGDEFTLVVSNVRSIRDVAGVAQRLLYGLSDPFELLDHEMRITAAIGISIFPYDGTDTETLIKNADSAMYHAKDPAEKSFQFYSSPMNANVLRNLTLENDLRKALDQNNLTLHYQPQIEIDTRQVVAMEALVRWRHPDRGVISPMEFIPLAEETGLILPIGSWVLESACRQNKAWQDEGMGLFRVAVNLSPLQFRQKSLRRIIDDTLRKTGLDARFLELEITESTVMRNEEEAIYTMAEIMKKGISLSMDDFGSGYSSLSYLKRFSLDTLKIDRTFIKDLDHDADDRAITAAIIAIAHNLGLRVVAEGVETEDQLSFLEEHLCDLVQGYLISPPRPPEDPELFKAGTLLAEALS